MLKHITRARIHSACACDKSIAFNFVRSCGRKRMIEQMKVEITGAKSRQEKMRTLEADKYFTSEGKVEGLENCSDILRPSTFSFVRVLKLLVRVYRIFSDFIII